MGEKSESVYHIMYPSLDDENYVEEFSITPNKILSFARQIAMAMVRCTTYRTCAINGQWGLMEINIVPLILIEIKGRCTKINV